MEEPKVEETPTVETDVPIKEEQQEKEPEVAEDVKDAWDASSDEDGSDEVTPPVRGSYSRIFSNFSMINVF